MRIRVIDIETTGLEPETDRIVEFGFFDIEHTGLGWNLGDSWESLVAGDPIPPQASAIHQIIDDDLKGAPPWDAVAHDHLNEGARRFGVEAYAAHNAKFEMGFITPDVSGSIPWICTYKAALRLWPDAPSHGNQVLKHWRKPELLDRSIADKAHRALPDAYVTALLLCDMLNGGASVEELIAWSNEPALLRTCQFGKYRGTPWSKIDAGYLRWAIGNHSDEDVIFTARTELDRRENEALAQ